MGTPFPHQIKKKTAANSLNKLSIRLQRFQHWTFLFHPRLLTSSAKLGVASTSVRLQPCFNVLSAKRCGNAVPTCSHPTTTLAIRRNWSGLLSVTQVFCGNKLTFSGSSAVAIFFTFIQTNLNLWIKIIPSWEWTATKSRNKWSRKRYNTNGSLGLKAFL